MNNVGKIFEFEDVNNGTSLFINAPDRFKSSDNKKVLDKYISWYNNDFVPYEKGYKNIKQDDYIFIRCFMFIDFYDDLNDRSI